MFRSVFALALVMVGLNVNATSNVIGNATSLTNNLIIGTLATQIPANTVLAWQVNDSLDYNISGGVIQGTAHIFVREETPQGFWLQQDMDLGFMGKQKVEVLYDKTNASVIEMIVNDQKQTPPDPADTEIIETKHDHITVPKGEFDCIYAKIHDKKQNNDAEAWINPKAVPISGMLKTISQSQMGPVTLELTDFKRN